MDNSEGHHHDIVHLSRLYHLLAMVLLCGVFTSLYKSHQIERNFCIFKLGKFLSCVINFITLYIYTVSCVHSLGKVFSIFYFIYLFKLIYVYKSVIFLDMLLNISLNCPPGTNQVF